VRKERSADKQEGIWEGLKRGDNAEEARRYDVGKKKRRKRTCCPDPADA
jgi:hypothetical protein